MAPVTVRRTAEDLRAERTQLLQGVAMSAKELRARAKRDALTGDQWDAFERLREIRFLLRGTAAH